MRLVLGKKGVWASGWSKKPIKPFNQFKLSEPFDRFNRLDRLFLNEEDEWVIILKIWRSGKLREN
jgi:hypothetical protein